MTEIEFFRKILPDVQKGLSRKDYVNIGKDSITFAGNGGFFKLRVDNVSGISLTISDNVDTNYYSLTPFQNGDLCEEYKNLYNKTLKEIQKEDYYRKGAELLDDLINS